MSRGMFYGSPSESTELSSAQGGMAVATMNESDDNQLIVPFNPEICYITDETGAILSLEDKIWNQFLADNCPIPLPAHIQRCTFPTILGKNLFEFIGDQKVQTFFRHIIYMLIAGMQDRYTYHWYCDSPEMERKMSMTVCKMTFLDNRQLILWCSKIIHEKKLSPPQKYISSPPEPITAEELMVGKPKRTVCSYCKRILVSADDLNPPAVQHVLQNMCKITGPLFDDGITPIIGLRGKLGQHVESQDGNPSTHLWLTPKQYYHMFRLDDEIVINHGVCEVCFQEIALLFFPPGSFKNGASTQNY
ncbi:hypothetical protein HK102_008924 [Quaeritorhiza haematococci]|nr:hypothetical protein HK102_008924 [Quaeritorhiza haematococci]